MGVRILVTGWFSFDEAEITAGDLLARDTAVRWLAESGLPHDVAVAENFRQAGDVSLADADPGAYTDVLFVCGPAAGKPVSEMFGRFPHARRLALGVSAVDGTAGLALGALLERDSDAAVRPDLSLAAPAAEGRPAVIGVVLVHAQPGYGDRHRLPDAHALLGTALSQVDVARVQLDTRLHQNEAHLCRTPAQVESALARCDAIATTRMHGLALSPSRPESPRSAWIRSPAAARCRLRPGRWAGPASPGSARPARESWPACSGGRCPPRLGPMAADVAGQARPALERLQGEFLALFTTSASY
jgi:hypothetical protein